MKNNFQNGFSLTELVLSIGIMITIFSITVPFISKQFAYFDLSVERDRLISNLRRARILSMTNRNSLPHGVYVSSSTFYVFEGTSFALRNQSYDEVYDRRLEISISGGPEILFTPLSGTTSSSTLILTSQNSTSTIIVNPEASISYY
ncbi:MAG: hypothetical protein EXS49_01020 [Candidatus Pacebacteria bacterium]|nr:hypothetical protein [Candidatus Paceibacterota bacterium]